MRRSSSAGSSSPPSNANSARSSSSTFGSESAKGTQKGTDTGVSATLAAGAGEYDSSLPHGSSFKSRLSCSHSAAFITVLPFSCLNPIFDVLPLSVS